MQVDFSGCPFQGCPFKGIFNHLCPDGSVGVGVESKTAVIINEASLARRALEHVLLRVAVLVICESAGSEVTNLFTTLWTDLPDNRSFCFSVQKLEGIDLSVQLIDLKAGQTIGCFFIQVLGGFAHHLCVLLDTA